MLSGLYWLNYESMKSWFLQTSGRSELLFAESFAAGACSGTVSCCSFVPQYVSATCTVGFCSTVVDVVLLPVHVQCSFGAGFFEFVVCLSLSIMIRVPGDDDRRCSQFNLHGVDMLTLCGPTNAESVCIHVLWAGHGILISGNTVCLVSLKCYLFLNCVVLDMLFNAGCSDIFYLR